MKAKEVIGFAKDRGAKMVDMKFCDLLGTWQHFAIPLGQLTEDVFEDGLGFDGSSIRGWKAINESDMLVIPDGASARMDPFIPTPTLSLICNIFDPITKQAYPRDPRHIAMRAEKFLQKTGIGDVAYFGPEPEFFIFDDIVYEQEGHTGYYRIDSAEGGWNTGRDESPNLGYKIRAKEGYFPVSPVDSMNEIRNEMSLTLESLGIEVERQHHEVASAGQAEIDMKYDSLVKMADTLMWFKHVVKNVAHKHGKTATFMPKPIFGDNGSGMHVHQSIWKKGQPLFAGDSYCGLSEMGLYYVGGLLKHARALCAITNPTTNSYRRLVPGFEAPVNLAYSSRNRSASIRVPMYSQSPKAKRIEYRTPDPSCNGYLAFAAMLMAGIDGIENKIHPGEPLDRDIYAMSPEELKNVPSAPGALEESLKALEADHEFLLKGDVFTKEIIETWIDYKKHKELNPVRLRPVPMEFELYYDC